MDKKENPLAGDLMTSNIISLHSKARFRDVVKLMHEKRVSSVIVHDEGSSEYYMISHSVVIDFLYYDADMKVFENVYDVPLFRIMRGPVKIVDKSMPIDETIRFMAEHGYKRVLVGEQGVPQGILSVRDILAWNNRYFGFSKPIFVMLIENESSILLAQHTFKDNFNETIGEKGVNQNLIELYGGALSSINAITDEILNHSGEMLVIQKEHYAILLEPRKLVTGILIADKNSIALRRRLYDFTKRFERRYREDITNTIKKRKGILEYDISDLVDLFTTKKNKFIY